MVFISIDYYIFWQYKSNKNTYLNEQYQLFSHVVNTAIVSLNNIADTVFYLRINNPEILQTICEADKNKKNWEFLRKKLIKKFMPDYYVLRKYGIRQLHFHLLNEISFVRFHKPDKYGDSLKNVRYSLMLVNKYKRIVRGFEEGRIFNGFRNVYPLFYKDKFIGSVEISFSAKAIINMIYKSYPAFYGLLLKKSDIKNKVWNEGDHIYRKQSMLDVDLVWDKKVLDYMLGLQFNMTDLQNLEKIFAKKIDLNNKNIYVSEYKNEDFILMLLPVKNIKGNTVAYLISLKKDNYLKIQRKHYLALGVLVTLLLIISSVFIGLYLQKRFKYFTLLEETSYKDPLTKLLNRRGLIKAIEELNGNFSMLFLDIDRFKKINDTFGHKVGDDVLMAIANILRQNVRKGDLIARWGGEEFLIVLPNCDIEDAVKIAENLRKKIEEYQGMNIPKFTSSFGVVSNVDKYNFEKKLNEADEYLYKAKKEGRNRVIWK